MPKKSEVIENLNWVTERISDRVWTISVGVIAVSLTYIVESAAATKTPFLAPRQVAFPAALAMLALASDLVQYMAANRQNLDLLRRMESEGLDEARFERDLMWRARMLAYRAKFWFCIGAASWIVVLTSARAISLMGTVP